MTENSEFKTIKQKTINKEVTLKITQNVMTGRIFVEFKSELPKLTLQKSFQNTMDGKNKSEKFAKSITKLEQLKEYFGIKEA